MQQQQEQTKTNNKDRTRTTMVGLAALVVVAGVGAYTVMSQPPSTAPPREASRCQDVPQGQLDAIATRLDPDVKITRAKAVLATGNQGAAFVSAHITIPGTSGTSVATWAVNVNLGDGRRGIYAADAMAEEFSGWPDGGSQFGFGADGMSQSRDCLTAAAAGGA